MSAENVLKYLGFIKTIVDGIKEIGYPAMKALLELLKDNTEPTIEDVQAIMEIMKDPESYFED